jgi:hypothetical protein
MTPESPPENDREGNSGKTPLGRLLRTRARRIGAAILGAIGLGVLGWITTSTTDLFESTKEQFFAGPALSVRVVPPGDFFAAHPYAPYYVVPQGRVASPAALSKAAAKGLISGGGELENVGVPGSPQVVRIELRAKSDEPVVVETIRVDVVKATSPVSGWFVARPACGVQPVRVVSVNLDSAPPTVTYLNEAGQPAGTLALRIARTEPEVLELQASTEHRSVDWTAEVLFSGPEGADSVAIDDGGDPFQVTTETASEGYRAVPRGSGVSFQREPTWDDGIDAC